MTGRKLRFLYLGRDDPENASDWSGIPYWTVRHLRERGHAVTAAQAEPALAGRLLSPARLAAYGLGRRLMHRYTDSYSKITRRRIRQLITAGAYDAVFCQDAVTAACARHPCVLYWCDALAEPLYEAYLPGYWRKVLNPQQVAAREAQAVSSARWVLCASEWVREPLAARHPEATEKFVLAPFPVGLPRAPDAGRVQAQIAARLGAKPKLLFIGVDWRRKGGDIAVALTQALRDAGVDATLTVVGATPFAPDACPAFVDQLGFLRKTDPTDMARLEQLLAEAHFLVLPSRAEAMGIALIEAHAYGVPTLTSRAGGIPGVVEDGANGFALDFTEVHQVARLIAPLFHDAARYAALASSARAVFDARYATERRMAQIERLVAKAA
ncbi:glycosyltransferase family 4 protein [Phenylobacterium sp. J426]|uniref:glycosyltransferase family 4 protein n=1 Tax=Phenylobacterium sp. J426 TaxID=2898439 RepID=UPI002151A4DC|nr:glycosyltransferase family 4 protein [Phenylobacterium sp. J426]MCR5876528.1 glycosyltransferase family 4 protein [Phenylobacterium sp. J426]